MSWVLLRGLTREHRHWGDFPQHLQAAFPQAKIIMPDLPGSALNHKQISPTTIKGILESVRADVQLQSLNQPVYLLGLSMGAMVSIEWLRHYPHECAAAVLMNTSLKGLSPFYQRLRPGNYGALFYSLLLNHNIRARENIIFNLTSNLNQDREATTNNWVKYASEHPVTNLNALRQLRAASAYRIPEHKPEQPILLLSGLADRLVNPQCSQSLAQHWALTLQSHPTAGHDLTLDDATWVCKEIIDWLATPAA